MTVVLVLFAFFGLFAAVFFGYDLFIFLFEKYSHFHMGRWTSKERWYASIEGVCKKWAERTPVLRLKKECRYLLLDRLTGKASKEMVQSWQKAGCLLGLEDSGTAKHEKTISAVKKKLLTKDGQWKKAPSKIDYAMMGYTLLRVESDPDAIRLAMDELVKCIEANLCEDGLVSYSMGSGSKRRYVDTVGFICPFLSLYGKIYEEPKYVQMAVHQLKLFRQRGFYKGIPVHSFEVDHDIPVGIIGWGRGTGWYMLGLIDTIKELNDGDDKNQLVHIALDLAESVRRFERPTGGFSSIMPAFNRYDSSATAMIGYFYAKLASMIEEPSYQVVAERCMTVLMKNTKVMGILDQCQGDTIDLGIFSDRYEEMPFAQGMALRLAASLQEPPKN